jgi:hypothetical protein
MSKIDCYKCHECGTVWVKASDAVKCCGCPYCIHLYFEEEE